MQVYEHGIVIKLNKAAEKLIGLSEEAVKGKSYFEILHGAQAKEACPLFAHPIKGGQALEVESSLKKLGRERRSFLSMIAHDMKHPVIVTLDFCRNFWRIR